MAGPARRAVCRHLPCRLRVAQRFAHPQGSGQHVHRWPHPPIRPVNGRRHRPAGQQQPGHHYRRPDVRELPGPSRDRPACAGGDGAWLLPDDQVVRNDAGRANGLERIFPAQGARRVSRRAGVPRPLRLRRDRHQQGEAGQAAAERVAERGHGQPRGQLDPVPHRAGPRPGVRRLAVSGRGGAGVLQAGDSRLQRVAADAQSDPHQPVGAGGQAGRRDPDGAFAVGVLPPGSRAAQPGRHPRHGVARHRRLQRHAQA